MLDPGDTVIAFYDGGDQRTILRWYLAGGHDLDLIKQYADVARWNSAWGVVAVIPPWQASGFTFVGATGQWGITLLLLGGRRYVLSARVRAFSGGSFAIRPGGGNTFPIVPDTYFPQYSGTPGWNNAYYSWLCEPSTTGLYTLVLDIVPTAGTPSVYGEVATIEDVGPVVLAASSPPAGQPSVVAAGNALGIVAMGSLVFGEPITIASNAATVITNPLFFTSQVGRRYRIVTRVRAMHPTSSGVGSGIYMRTYGEGLAQNDTHVWIQHPFQWLDNVALFNGTGVPGTYTTSIVTTTATGLYVYTNLSSCYFYIEDVGPNTYPALPLLETPPLWTPLTVGGGWAPIAIQAPVGYRKIGDEVSLRGVINNGVNSSSPLTMPPGTWPPYPHNQGTIGGSQVSVNVHVTTAGVLSLNWQGADAPARNFVILNGVHWSTTP